MKKYIGELLYYIILAVFTIVCLQKIDGPQWFCFGFILCLSLEIIMMLYSIHEIIDYVKEKIEKKVREIEDRIDAEAARKAIEESEREGYVSWEEIKKEHDLE